MNEQEFIKKYEEEKPLFRSWGNKIAETINQKLFDRGINPSEFLKIPINVRIKDNTSIIAKAFLRKDKKYTDPYTQITDKVGIRFVVLDLDEINVIKEIIEAQDDWDCSKDVDFEKNCAERPELFVYQSVHYIVRNCNIVDYNGVKIPANTPCEIQIRTLLQHAYAELSHQTVYKSNAQINPMVKRKLARSMALIEATDELFKEVRQDMRIVDDLYISIIDSAKNFISFPYYIESLSSTIFDSYKESIIKNNISTNIIEDFINNKSFLIQNVKDNKFADVVYQQPIIFLLYYLAEKYSSTLLENWPFDRIYIEPIFTDLGISI